MNKEGLATPGFSTLVKRECAHSSNAGGRNLGNLSREKRGTWVRESYEQMNPGQRIDPPEKR